MFFTLRSISHNLELRSLKRKVAAGKAILARKLAEEERLKDEKVRLMLALIGALTVFWAKLECRLDHINELAFLNGAKDVIDAEVPRALERKLQFMKRSHAKLPWLQEIGSEGQEIVQAFKNLRDDRHQLIHGAVENINTDDELKFIRHIHGAGPLQLDIQEFSPERFLSISVRLAELSKLIEQHHRAMNDALLRYRLRQIQGQ